MFWFNMPGTCIWLALWRSIPKPLPVHVHEVLHYTGAVFRAQSYVTTGINLGFDRLTYNYQGSWERALKP